MHKPFLNHRGREVKSAFIAFIQTMPKETTFALTLQTHNPYMKWSRNAVNARRQKYDPLLSQWDKLLARHFVGPNFHKKSRENERQSGFAFPEKFHVSPHYHLVVDIKSWDRKEYQMLAEEFWEELCPSSTVDIVPIYNNKWEGYSMKDWDISEPDGWIPIPYVQK